MGIRGSDLESADAPVQISLFNMLSENDDRASRIDKTVDSFRGRFGKCALQRAVVMCDSKLTGAIVKAGGRR